MEKSGANLKITNKVGTSKGTIFEATLSGSQEQISMAIKMIQFADEKAYEWSQKKRVAKQFFQNEATPKIAPKASKPKASKTKPSRRIGFNLLQVEEPEEPEKPKNKHTSNHYDNGHSTKRRRVEKEEPKKVSWANLAASEPNQEVKEPVVEAPKKQDLKKLGKMSWADIAELEFE